MIKKFAKHSVRVAKKQVAISGTFPKNWKGADCESCACKKGAIEVHAGLGWKTAFGFHLEKKEPKTWENYKMSPGIYLHPKSRPSKFGFLSRIWLWLCPFTVFTKDGAHGFISQNRAVDFYYQISSKLIGNAVASIERKGWLKPCE